MVTPNTQDNSKLINDQYAKYGKSAIGTGANNIDQQGYDYWNNQLTSGALNKDNFSQAFENSAAEVLRNSRSAPANPLPSSPQRSTSTGTTNRSVSSSSSGSGSGSGSSSGGVVSNAMQPTYGTATAAGYSAATRQINKPPDTVQGQMESILATDSPLMQRARTIAKQGMAQRGLVNSSMSQGAGVAAMIDRATPIASQDANAYNVAASDNMNAVNTAGMFSAGESNKFGLQRNDQTFTAGENAADRSFRTSERLGSERFTSGENALTRESSEKLQLADQNFRALEGRLDRDQQVSVTRLNNDLSNANVSRTFAGNLALATSNQVAAIAADPNLSSVVDAATGTSPKKAAIQNAIDNANATMQWGSTFYNMPLPTIATPGGTAGSVRPGEGAGAGSGSVPQTVNDLYRQYAGREGEAAGLDYWRQRFGPTIEPDEARIFASTVEDIRAQERARK
jgi:hypothetical protein